MAASNEVISLSLAGKSKTVSQRREPPANLINSPN